MATLDDAYAELWRAVNVQVPLNPDAGIFKAWKQHYRDWGSPLHAERELAGGGSFQTFSRAIVKWSPENGVEVVSEG